MPATIFEDSDLAKVLRNSINLNDQAKILTGSDDPTDVAKDAPRGSIYMRTGGSGGEIYRKTDDGSSTSWVVIASGTTGPAQSIAYQLDVLTAGIRAGETISANDAVCLVQFDQDGFLVMKAEADQPRFRNSFMGFAKSSASVTQGSYTLTLDASFVTGNTCTFDLNGDQITETFSTTSDDMLAAIATKIQAHPDVQSATVTTVGAGTENDREIVILSGNGRGGAGSVTILADNISVTGGASQANFTFGTTTAAAGGTVDIHRFGHLGGFSSLTVGDTYFLSATAGAISNTPSGNVPLTVGYALSTTTLLSDPPKAPIPAGLIDFIRSHGDASGVAISEQADSEHYNFTTWSAGVSDGAALCRTSMGEGGYQGLHHVVDGVNTGPSIITRFVNYNKASWNTDTNRASNRQGGGISTADNYLYVGKGVTATDGGGSTGGTNLDRWNGTSWDNPATFSAALSMVGCFEVSTNISWVGGRDNVGTTSTSHEIYNGSSISAGTAVPAADSPGASSRAASSTGVSQRYNSTTVDQWNGSSWVATFTASTVTTNQAGGNGVNSGAACGFDTDGYSYNNGGCSGASTSIKSAQVFDGSSYNSFTVSTNERAGAAGSVI